MKTLTLTSVCAAVALTLSACGGGSSSSGPTYVNAGIFTENAYVTGAAGAINQYSINASGGLVPLTTPTVTTGGGVSVSSIVITPNKQFAYATSTGDNKIYQFTIGSDGSLTANGSVPTNAPVHAVVDSGSSFLYVSNGGTNATVSEFSINPSTGVLTSVGSSSTTGCGASAYPAGLAINASALYFVTPSAVCAFALGSLTTLGTVGTPVALSVAHGLKAVGSGNNKWITLGSKGLYISDGSNIYEVSKSNAVPVPTITTASATTNGTFDTATVTTYALAGVGNVPVSSVDLYAPAASTVAQYTLNTTTGVPSALPTPTVASATGALSFVAIDTTSSYLYAAGATGISQYTIGSGLTANTNGLLTPNATPSVTGPATPTYIAFR